MGMDLCWKFCCAGRRAELAAMREGGSRSDSGISVVTKERDMLR